jgi:hypothetical protein
MHWNTKVVSFLDIETDDIPAEGDRPYKAGSNRGGSSNAIEMGSLVREERA